MDTAKDWADEVKSFCEGKLKMTNYSFMKQDNIKRRIVQTDGRSLDNVNATPTNQLRNMKLESVRVKQEPFEIKQEVY